MPRVLVVEDDQDKLRRVLLCLKEVPGIAASDIENARDSGAAKRLLRQERYDLLVLDIALPDGPDAAPTPDGGVRLLRELIEREIYRRPTHVVGLTGYPEIMAEATAAFQEDLWSVVRYDAGSDVWREQLKRRLRHIILAERGEPSARYGIDLCVITALQSPELMAVLRLPWGFEAFELPNDGTVYHRGHYPREGAREVVATAAPRMGMTATAVLASKMIHAFRPRYLAMVGILAGVRGACELGDIIVADPSWDYESGKRHLGSTGSTFAPSPHQVALSPSLRGRLGRLANDQNAIDAIRRGWPGTPAPTPLTMRLGPVASGGSVLEDPAVTATIRSQHRKTVGIEMETYGVMVAAEESPVPQPQAFSLKSVCDFADPEKNDDFQTYAAYTSASALRAFMEQYS